jgi:hypothetical protein
MNKNITLAREIILPILEIWASKPRRFKLEFAAEIIADLNDVLAHLNWHNLENDYESHENFVRAAMMLADIHAWRKEFASARLYHRLLLTYYNVQIAGDGWDPYMEVTRIEQLLKIADFSDALGDCEEAALALKTARVEFKKHRYDGGFDEKYCGLKEARFLSLLMKYHEAVDFCDFSKPFWKYDEFAGSKNFKSAKNPARKQPEFAQYPHPSPDDNHPLLGLAQQKSNEWHEFQKLEIDARKSNAAQILLEIDDFLRQIAKNPFQNEANNRKIIEAHLTRATINIDQENYQTALKDLRAAANICCILIGKYDDFMIMYHSRSVFMLLYKTATHLGRNIEAEVAIDYFIMMDNQVGYRDWRGIFLVKTGLDDLVSNPQTYPYNPPQFKIPLHWGKKWPFDR